MEEESTAELQLRLKLCKYQITYGQAPLLNDQSFAQNVTF